MEARPAVTVQPAPGGMMNHPADTENWLKPVETGPGLLQQACVAAAKFISRLLQTVNKYDGTYLLIGRLTTFGRGRKPLSTNGTTNKRMNTSGGSASRALR